VAEIRIERVKAFGTYVGGSMEPIKVYTVRPGHPVTVSRLIVATNSFPGFMLLDQFERIVAPGGWGSPNVGLPYAVQEGAAADFQVNLGVGQIASGGGVARHSVSSDVAGFGPIDVSITGVITNVGAFPAASVLGLTARQFLNLYYEVFVRADGTQVSLGKYFAGTETVMATAALVPALAPPIHLRLTCTANTISGSAWSGVEPSTPMLEAIDFDLLTTGGVGALAQSSAAVAATAFFDTFVATAAPLLPIFDAYLGDPGIKRGGGAGGSTVEASNLQNIIDSSIFPTNRWVPQVVNGQRLFPGDQLFIVGRTDVSTAGFNDTDDVPVVVDATMLVE